MDLNLVYWPVKFIHLPDIIRSGLIYEGDSTILKCLDCKVELKSWKEDDDPVIMHINKSPDCQLVQNADSIEEHLKKPAANRLKSTLSSRLITFDNIQPDLFPVPIDDLVIAGFFYTGIEDLVECHFCNIKLLDWNSTDVPWKEHAVHSCNCQFVRLHKGPDYIDEALKEKNMSTSSF